MTDTIVMVGLVGLLFLVARFLSSRDERTYASTFKSPDVTNAFRRSVMNNCPGNIQLSQEEDDNLARITGEATIKNIDAQLAKMPKGNPRHDARRKALTEQRDAIEDRLTAINAERPKSKDGLSDGARAAIIDIEAQLEKLPKTRASEAKARALLDRKTKILDHADAVLRARDDEAGALHADREPPATDPQRGREGREGGSYSNVRPEGDNGGNRQ